jgi:cbb3-type cytochrome oxidase maturation protein
VTVLFVLVPLVLIMVLAWVLAYVWAARRGQFDDLATPAIRVVLDVEPEPAGRHRGRPAAVAAPGSLDCPPRKGENAGPAVAGAEPPGSAMNPKTHSL